MRKTPFIDWRTRFRAGKFGMGLFLASLSMVFSASLLGFLVIRLQLGEKGLWPADLPPLPSALWISTGVLIASSITMQWALHAVRFGRTHALQVGMTMTTLLGLAFVLVQANCWVQWFEPVWQRWSLASQYRYALTSFYVLTGLHALHVIGGLIPMVFVTRHAYAGRYSSGFYPGVQFCTVYWHFFGAVWIVLFVALEQGM